MNLSWDWLTGDGLQGPPLDMSFWHFPVPRKQVTPSPGTHALPPAARRSCDAARGAFPVAVAARRRVDADASRRRGLPDRRLPQAHCSVAAGERALVGEVVRAAVLPNLAAPRRACPVGVYRRTAKRVLACARPAAAARLAIPSTSDARRPALRARAHRVRCRAPRAFGSRRARRRRHPVAARLSGGTAGAAASVRAGPERMAARHALCDASSVDAAGPAAARRAEAAGLARASAGSRVGHLVASVGEPLPHTEARRCASRRRR